MSTPTSSTPTGTPTGAGAAGFPGTAALGSPAPPAGGRARSDFELYAWVFMRVSGVLLVLLVLAHFAIMHLVGGGISRVSFAFVSGRWSNPFWRVYDFAMLSLALLHGGNGLRVIIDDYAASGARRLAYHSLSLTVVLLTWVLGSMTIFIFTPKG